MVVVSGIVDRNIPYKVGATSGFPEFGKVETNNMFDITTSSSMTLDASLLSLRTVLGTKCDAEMASLSTQPSSFSHLVLHKSS